MTDDQVQKGLTDEFDLGYKGDLGGFFVEEVQRAGKITRTGEANAMGSNKSGRIFLLSCIRRTEWGS